MFFIDKLVFIKSRFFLFIKKVFIITSLFCKSIMRFCILKSLFIFSYIFFSKTLFFGICVSKHNDGGTVNKNVSCQELFIEDLNNLFEGIKSLSHHEFTIRHAKIKINLFNLLHLQHAGGFLPPSTEDRLLEASCGYLDKLIEDYENSAFRLSFIDLLLELFIQYFKLNKKGFSPHCVDNYVTAIINLYLSKNFYHTAARALIHFADDRLSRQSFFTLVKSLQGRIKDVSLYTFLVTAASEKYPDITDEEDSLLLAVKYNSALSGSIS